MNRLRNKMRLNSFTKGDSFSKSEDFVLHNIVEEEEFPSSLIKIAALETKTPFSTLFVSYVKRLTASYMRSNVCRIIVILAAFISCIFYVIDAYNSSRRTGSDRIAAVIIDIILFVIFLIDYIFNIIYAPFVFSYIFGVQGILDFASLLSIINVFNAASADLSYLPLFRLMRVMKVLRLLRTQSLVNLENFAIPSAAEAILFETISLGVGISLSLFIAASVLYTIVQQDPEAIRSAVDPNFDMESDFTWFDSLYFIFVLISTLGLGDFVPNNFTGRVFVVIMLILTFTVVPTKVGQLVEMIRDKPKYMNEFELDTNHPHVVLCANLTAANFQRIINLILSQGTYDAEIVEEAPNIALLSNVMPSPAVQLLLAHPTNSRKVQFLRGTPKSSADLRRCKAHKALAVVIFCEEELNSIEFIEQDDYNTKLKAISTVNYISRSITLQAKKKQNNRTQYMIQQNNNAAVYRPVIIAQTQNDESKAAIENYGIDRVIGLNSLKYGILAYGAMFPGFINLIFNLTVPSGSFSITRQQYKWHDELNYGASFELVEIPVAQIGNEMQQLTFSQACRALYQLSDKSMVLIAVYGYMNNNKVYINPERQVRIIDCTSLFVITRDTEMAVAVLNIKNLATRLRELQKTPLARARGLSTAAFSQAVEEAAACESPPPGSPSSPVSPSGRRHQSVRFRRDTASFRVESTSRRRKTFDLGVSGRSVGSEPSSEGRAAAMTALAIPEEKELTPPESKKVFLPIRERILSPSHNTSPDSSGEDVVSAVRTTSDLSIQPGVPLPSSEGIRHAATDDFLNFRRPALQTSNSFHSARVLQRRSSTNDGNFSAASSFGEEFSNHGIFTRFYLVLLVVVIVICAFAPGFTPVRIAVKVEACLKAMRSRCDDHVVVLAEKAEEIQMKLTKRNKDNLSLVRDNVTFISGTPNSSRSLKQCQIYNARCIVIIGNEVAKDGEDDIANANDVNNDLHIILASLEVEWMLKKRNRILLAPFVILELFDENNISFISGNMISRARNFNRWISSPVRTPIPRKSLVHVSESVPVEVAEKRMSRRSMPLLKAMSSISEGPREIEIESDTGGDDDFFNWRSNSLPAFIEGRVVTQELVDALTVQSLFNPHILDFWRVIMANDTNEDDNLHGPQMQGKLDKLEIPIGFQGTFQDLFELLLHSYGTIAIAIHRHSSTPEQPRYVAVLPAPDSLIGSHDQVFVLLAPTPV